MVAAAPPDEAQERRYLADANFEDVTFAGRVDFSNVRFGKASFRGATFEDAANFDRAHFDDQAQFACTTFQGTVSFADAVFRCEAIFEHQERDTVERSGRREEVTFRRWADFRDARFERGASFGGAVFERRARFGGATFGTAGAEDDVKVSFVGARFVRARSFGPLLARGKVALDRVIFESPVRIEISARDITCVGTQFMARTSMEVRWAAVDLEDAEFAQPSIVSGASRRFQLEDRFGHPAGRVLEDADVGRRAKDRKEVADEKAVADPTPKVTSVHRTNVSNLTLAGMELSACRFVGAHNLDGLRFEGSNFRTVANVWGTHRRAICEEVELAHDDPARAEQIARTYRALRKGREDNKDEPGAADFYYGEMEMRRKARRRRRESGSAKRTSWSEWLVLWMYRVFSGYGLRSSRALFALLVTLFLFAWGFQAWGFDPDQNFWRSLLFSVESAPSLFRPPTLGKEAGEQIQLTYGGHVLQMGLRLLGPLFFGLALLALRGRVKR
jgi:uncharacterized protein YjbI with pentapeptide repeats